MNSLTWLERRRYRAVWSDPHRALLTLESFADTEEDGGRDLQAAALRVRDADVRNHIHRHAEDELRHARLFRDRARAVAEAQGRHLVAVEEEMGRAYDLSGTRSPEQVNSHGFFQAGLFDEMGEVGYVAMLHVAERRAAHLFALHLRAARAAGDEATGALFAEILKDERYHVAWTNTVLQRWRGEGREAEVARALGAARRGRALDAWRRLGLRSASGLATVLLCVVYWTLLAPFGLLARRSRSRDGWQAARTSPLSSQY